MLVNSLEPAESRIAVIHDRRLEEIYVERSSNLATVGNIYKAKVANIEKGLQAAFVDFCGGKNGFLHVSDIKLDAILSSRTAGRGRTRKKAPVLKDQPIEKLIKGNEEMLVQVTKEGIRDKCPSLTNYISIPGRYLVLMPYVKKRGISRKIMDEEERQRLKVLMKSLDLDNNMGFIVRTAGMDCTKEDLENDGRYLMRLWRTVEQRVAKAKPGDCLYQESDLVIRTIRDLFSDQITEILVDTDENYKKIKDFLRNVMPGFQSCVKPYKGLQPIFEKYRIDEQMAKLYHRKVSLSNGGSIVIEETEALVAIDVNSGSYKGGGDPERVIYQTNLAAVKEVARQLRLRDMGGMIVVDFIDMSSAEFRNKIETALQKELKKDRARTRVLRMSRFCLIEMTRQRVRPALKRTVYDPCPVCLETGFVKSPESVAIEILRIIRAAVRYKRVVIVEFELSNHVADHLLNEHRQVLLNLEKQSQKRIVIKGRSDVPVDSRKASYLDAARRPVKL